MIAQAAPNIVTPAPAVPQAPVAPPRPVTQAAPTQVQATAPATAAVQAAPATAPAATGEATAAKPKRAVNGVYVQTPAVLREKLVQVAAAENKTPATYVRDLLAQMWGITLPPARTRQRYETPEQKKAAQTAKRIDRQNLIKQLLADYQKRMAAEAGAHA